MQEVSNDCYRNVKLGRPTGKGEGALPSVFAGLQAAVALERVTILDH